MGAQEALDQRDRGRAVDIVVAEHRDGSAARMAAAKRSAARSMSCSRAGSGNSVRSDGSRWRAACVRLGAARGEHAAEQLGQAVRLGDGRGGERAAGIEPLDPAIAARRALHAEHGRRAIAFRYMSYLRAAVTLRIHSLTISDASVRLIRRRLAAQSNLPMSGCSVLIQRTVLGRGAHDHGCG